MSSFLRLAIRQLLVEGRLEDAQKKYPNVDVTALADADPSGRAAKYLMWMAKQVDAGASTMDVIPTVNAFHKAPQKFKHRDINRYTAKELEDEWKDLELASDQSGLASASELRRLAKSGATEIYRDNEHIVHRIRDKAAAQAYGKGTRWCITMSDGNYFDEYDSKNVVFYFATRLQPLGSAEEHDDRDKLAYAILRNDDNKITGVEVYDAADNLVTGGTVSQQRPSIGVLSVRLENAIIDDVPSVPKAFGADMRSRTASPERIQEEFIKAGKIDAKNQLMFLARYAAWTTPAGYGGRSEFLEQFLYSLAVDADVRRVIQDIVDGIAQVDQGSIKYYVHGELHRINGPAAISKNGYMAWYRDGVRHRDNGPAETTPGGYEAYWVNGKRHRQDGPATINANGTGEWWIYGNQLSKSRFDREAMSRGWINIWNDDNPRREELRQLMKGRTFSDMSGEYNIGDILYFIERQGGRITENERVADLINQLNVDTDEVVGSKEWIRRANRADLSYPIIILRDEDGERYIVDGLHRLWKANDLGHKHIKAQTITRKELASIPRVNDYIDY